MRTKNRFFAFTLVELLVVIGIIAMLIGILLPALSAAQESSRGIKCLANIRQIGTGFQMYQAAFKGYIAMSDDLCLEMVSPDRVTGFITDKVARNINCPTFSAITDGASGRGYGSNTWLAEVQARYYHAGAGFRPAHVRDASQVVIFADTATYLLGGVAYGAAQGFINPYGVMTNIRSDGKTLETPTFHARHRGRGSVLWFDGHGSLETPTFIPSGLTVNGVPSDTFKKCSLGFLVPPGVPVNSMLGQAYSFLDPTILTTTDNVKTFVDYVVDSSGVGNWQPKFQYWR
jgi:prepilin-type processing-associated H-X9-DG protein